MDNRGQNKNEIVKRYEENSWIEKCEKEMSLVLQTKPKTLKSVWAWNKIHYKLISFHPPEHASMCLCIPTLYNHQMCFTI